MNTHDGIVAFRTDKSEFFAIVRADVFVLLNACRQGKLSANRGSVEATIKVDPLAAVFGPSLPAISNGDFGSQ